MHGDHSDDTNLINPHPSRVRSDEIAEMRARAPKVSARVALLNLVDALAEDVMSMSDDELLAELEEDGEDIDRVVKRFNAALEKAKRRAALKTDLSRLANRHPSRRGPFVFDEDELQKQALTTKEPDDG